MKKYIAIAALVVASIVLVAFAVLPGHSADNTTAQSTTATAEQIKYDREFVQAQSAEIARHVGTGAEASNEIPYEGPSAGAKITKEEEARAKDISDIQPMKRPELFVKTIPGSSGDIVTIVTKEDGGTGIHVRPPVPNPENSAEYQPGVLKKTTTPTETYREFQVLVMTSTNLVNWYPVSYGEKYPETKQPRYFRLWTQIDESQATRERFFKNHPEALANIDEMIARTSGEAQERLKKLRQAVENSK